MEYNRINIQKRLTISPHSTEPLESTRKTPQRFSDPQFSFPQSPKLPLEILTALQDKILEKELAFVECTKQRKHLETENSDLKVQLKEKESELARLTEENFKLKADLRDNEYNLSSYWKKEVLRKSEGLKKYQEQIRCHEKEQRIKLESELKKLIDLFENEQKANTLKFESNERQIHSYTQRIKDLESENEKLRSDQSHFSEIDFEKQLQELEIMQTELLHENTSLKQELEIIRRGNNLQDLALLSADIHKITRQVHSLLTILKNLQQGKEISLYLLLEMDEARVVSSSRQLVIDVAQLKKDLNEIKEIVSDYHADIVGGNICTPQ